MAERTSRMEPGGAARVAENPSGAGAEPPAVREPPIAGRGLRSDARHNRRRIMEAARAAFAERGIDVPMVAIARRAGVGPATLYRRFPTRETLVAEVFADEMAECAGLVDEALADPDPWRAFCTVLTEVCAMQAADKGFTEAFLAAFPDSDGFDERRVHVEHGLDELIRRAKESGRLRADFAREDIVLVLLANGGIVTSDPETTRAASRRLVAHMLRSFESAGGSGELPPVPPIGLGQLYRLPGD
ncbi:MULTISPECIES: TetR/AcrR family transcriptional regulator [Nocardiopsidaceae]|uniref:TetR/AcrR family transcriptional regulator n=1 Tax=Streptomonospora nanhaiensis TaxID=1323731 RepID=A0ABY6YGN9_9ACTN|nr:TetR/AcrR family transcriptional regulator [Streptomonospora nanhaiensis]WAE71435.1 TetR/AcrR family transcriptional regulator [Streptomonospora nanhaiensis]